MEKNANTQSARGVTEFVPIPKHEQVLNEKGRVTHKLEIDGLEFWLLKTYNRCRWSVTEETSGLHERFETRKKAMTWFTEWITKHGIELFKERISAKIKAREQYEKAQQEAARVKAEEARVKAEEAEKFLEEAAKIQKEQENAEKKRGGTPLERYEQAKLDIDEIERGEWNISDDGKIGRINRSEVFFLSVDDFLVDYIGEKDRWNESDKKEAEKVIRLVESKLNFSELRDKAMTFEGQASLF